MVKKERQRYVLFKIIGENMVSFEKKELLNSIWNSIWRYFGMKEANKIGLWLLELDLENKYGILRCSHNTKDVIISALSFIKEINGTRVILSPIKTSGTIKAIGRIKNLTIK